MDTLIIGENIYEIVDEAARVDVETLKQRSNASETNIQSLQQRADTTESDLDKVKLATITPDTSLGIAGAAADSKVVGDAIQAIENEIDQLNKEIDSKIDSITPETIGAVNVSNIANNITTVTEGYVM